MADNYTLIEKYLSGKTSPEETIAALTAIATNPELEEYVVTQRRLDYEEDKLKDYGSFIPASSMAADDGRNLCDLQCELFILRKLKRKVSETLVSQQSKNNYWLRDQGTPLYNVGRLLESKGYNVHRSFNSNLQQLKAAIKDRFVIAIVNGDVLSQKSASDSFSLENDANHAVVVLRISETKHKVSLYNPAKEEGISDYHLDTFLDAWSESKNYMVTADKRQTNEYHPQPIDVSQIALDDDLLELVELLAENAHDVWGLDKIEKAKADKRILAYDKVDGDRDIQEGGATKKMRYSHYFVPYSRLSEEDKKPDRDSVTSTVKLIKRLGYRLVNINSMYKCPECGEVIEPSFHYCPCCGRELTWEDFK